MSRLAFAIGLLALSVGAVAEAHADFAAVRFKSGYCRVWTNTAAAPQDFQYLAFQRHWRGHRWWQHQFATLGGLKRPCIRPSRCSAAIRVC